MFGSPAVGLNPNPIAFQGLDMDVQQRQQEPQPETAPRPQTAAPSCPICGHSTRALSYVPGDWRRPTVQTGWHLYWCDVSKLGFVDPRPTKEEVTEFYRIEDYYTHRGLPPKTATSSGLQKALTHLAWRADRSRDVDPQWFSDHFGTDKKQILDIGCGSGRLLERLREIGHEIVGLEPDPRAREECRKRGVIAHDGNAEHVPDALRGSRFDVVLMCHVLEHTIDPLAALRNTRQLLHDTGHLVVEVPNHGCKGFSRSGMSWAWLDVPRHLTFFTGESLVALLRAAGFEADVVEHRGYVRQFSEEWRSWEQRAWDVLAEAGAIGLPERPSMSASWKLFFETWRAPDAEKYDSVRVIARPRSS